MRHASFLLKCLFPVKYAFNTGEQEAKFSSSHSSFLACIVPLSIRHLGYFTERKWWYGGDLSSKHLSCMCEDLGLIPSSERKNRKRERKRDRENTYIMNMNSLLCNQQPHFILSRWMLSFCLGRFCVLGTARKQERLNHVLYFHLIWSSC